MISLRCSLETLESRIAPAFAAFVNIEVYTAAEGFKVNGERNEDHLGNAVSVAGDINGDGFADIVVGARHGSEPMIDHSNFRNGAAYVVFGHSEGFAPKQNVGSLDGQNGFRITGEDRYDFAGFSVSGAGDVNGDGFDDLIVGAPSERGAGAAYVVFGKAGGYPAELDLGSLDGNNGFKVAGANERMVGFSVSGAGDVNGDGFADMIVGASNRFLQSDRGAAYILFGKSGSFPAMLDLSALNGSDGVRLRGAVGDNAGYSVSGAGDINGDGFGDVIVGARGASPDGLFSGSAYVLFGHGGPFAASMELSAVDGSSGFRLDGTGDYNFTGIDVDAAGDVNGDGFEDVFVSNADRGYVLFGHAGMFPTSLRVSAIGAVGGFALSEGLRGATAGDVNGDGITDFIVGSQGASRGGTYSGASYVVFGKAGPFPAEVDVRKLNGKDGFQLLGSTSFDYTGYSVSGGGDINGDGFADIIIGAPLGVPGRGTGMAYVVFGGDPGRLRIAESGRSAHFADVDGDRVTVTTSAGTFTKEMFDLRAEGLGFQLEKLDLTDPAFTKADLTFSAQRQDATGDGMKDGNKMVNIGFLDASGVTLGTVTIPGDLGQIDAAKLKTLSIASLGALGTGTQDAAASSLHSDIARGIKAFNIAGDIGSGVTLAIGGRLGTAQIGGNLDGATITALGKLAPASATDAVAIASLAIGGHVSASQILAGYDLAGMPVNADASIGAVIVRGTWSASSLVAGLADATGDGFGRNDTLIPGGSDGIIASIARIKIKGPATGSAAADDFFGIAAESILKARISRLAVALTSCKDDLLLDAANEDFRLVEVQPSNRLASLLRER